MEKSDKGIFKWMEDMSHEAYPCGEFDLSIFEEIKEYLKSQGVERDNIQFYYEGKWYEVDTHNRIWIWFEYKDGELIEVESPIKGSL